MAARRFVDIRKARKWENLEKKKKKLWEVNKRVIQCQKNCVCTRLCRRISAIQIFDTDSGEPRINSTLSMHARPIAIRVFSGSFAFYNLLICEQFFFLIRWANQSTCRFFLFYDVSLVDFAEFRDTCTAFPEKLLGIRWRLHGWLFEILFLYVFFLNEI